MVFLHGNAQSHNYQAFADAPTADLLSPLVANQGGVTWVENAREKAFVLVPQAPARDTRDTTGERGWRSTDTRKLLLALVDKLIAENPAIDTNRLYLTGLSMGASGSWKLISDPDPAVSKKFAAGALVAGIPANVYYPVRTESQAQRQARILSELQAFDYRHVTIPLWLVHANTDPVVDRLGSRVPFARITAQATMSATGDMLPSAGVMIGDNGLVRRYRAANPAGGSEVHYIEYQFD